LIAGTGPAWLIFGGRDVTVRANPMQRRFSTWILLPLFLGVSTAVAAPVITPIGNVGVPAGKSLTLPVTATSPNGRPLTFSVTSSTSGIAVEVHTNNPFWKMSVVQAAPANAPAAFQTPFRGGLVLVTNVGDLTFMLFRDRAPHTVDVITGLSAGGFYNSNTIFHRVIPGFVIQGGDPSTNGSGGPVFRYDDEFDPRAFYTGNGQLALANSGKDTDGSQFFVTLGPQRFLDLSYTLFGQLLRGFNVLTNIISTPRNVNDRPLADVIITRASLVPNTTDTVITLTGTNLAGVAGTIQVIADDGAGGIATNTFTANTVADANNAPAILKTPAVKTLVIPMNGRVTNQIAALDVEGNSLYYHAQFANSVDQLNATNSSLSVDGSLVIAPNPGYSGPLNLVVYASQTASFSTFDSQAVTFSAGDTEVSARGTIFTARSATPATNQILATFTNGVPNSSSGSFTALINWGDNSTNNGMIVADASGRKEVRGSHTYTNSGHYPVYVRIKSVLGAEATVVSTALVPPSLAVTRLGSGQLLGWPAWATEYELQTQSNLATMTWAAVTNLPALVGYENLVTNTLLGTNRFFRLAR
jgi:cyclophilin family peptidyl-prolyl cis-trans isomerase